MNVLLAVLLCLQDPAQNDKPKPPPKQEKPKN